MIASTGRVVFFETADRDLVAVHSEHVPRFPFSRVARRQRAVDAVLTLPPGAQVRFEETELLWDSGRIEVAPCVPTVCLAVNVDPARMAQLAHLCRRHRARHGYAVQLADRLAVAAHDDVRDELGSLLGCGPGLTPTGDDVLLGLLAGARLLNGWPGESVLRAALGDNQAALRGTTTRVSAELLRHALAGSLPPAVVDVCRSVEAGVRQTPMGAVEHLARIGGTSGSDIILGLSLSLEGPADRLGAMNATG